VLLPSPPLSVDEKIFVIGLPRTGTTSVCAALLDMGFKVAHTAFTREAVEQAQVIADTPAFSEFSQLHTLFPKARFIYLQRDLKLWLPSIQTLLEKMSRAIQRGDGVINPLLERCFAQVFGPFGAARFHDDQYLAACYQRHFELVRNYFSTQTHTLLSLDVSETDSVKKLADFMSVELARGCKFPRLNSNGKITAWKDIRHPLKIDSNASGEYRRQYYSYDVIEQK